MKTTSSGPMIVVRSAVALLLAVTASAALAAGPTAVSGTISSNTTWTENNSPYVLSGDVQITDGAYLTIRPGVEVLGNAGASLTVLDGALSAQGTSESPIRFSGVSNEPGTWGPLKFSAGTINASSTLSHVQVRYGRGVVVESASPTLSDVQIEDNDAPAVTIDLIASPVGERLSASGNRLNGILVPSGVISGQVVWGLKGIPYVVVEGMLEVGAAPFGFAPAIAQIPKGRMGHLALNLPSPAPAEGLSITLHSSAASVARVDSQIAVPTGARSIDVAVSTLALGDAEITAEHPALGTARAHVTVTPQPSLTLSPSAVSVGVGRTSSVTVQIPAGLAVGDLPVNLGVGSSAAEVPASVTIPARATSVRFDVQGRSPGTTSLSATADGFNSTSANVRVEALALLVPSTAFVAPDLSADLTIKLNYPAPAGGLTVTIQNSNSAIVGVPASATIPAGEMSATVALTGLLEDTSAAALTFTAPGYITGYTSVTVRRITVRLGSSEQELQLARGVASNFAVTLSKPAPAGGVVLNIAAAASGALSIQPAQVTVPEGQTVATTEVSLTGSVAGRSLLSLVSSADTPGIDGAFSVFVKDSLLQFTESERITIHKHLTRTVGLRCDVNYRLCDFDTVQAITLSNSDPAAMSVPSQIAMAAHDGLASFQVTALETTNGDAVISASSPFLGLGSVAVSVGVLAPELIFQGVENDVLAVGESKSFNICLSSDGREVSPSDIRVGLSITDIDPPTLIAGLFLDAEGTTPADHVTIPAGQSCTGLYTGKATAPGSYRIAVNVPGWGSWKSEPRDVVRGKLFFEDGPSIVLGEGLTKPYVRIWANPCRNPIHTSVNSGDPSKVSVSLSHPDSCYDQVFIKGEALTEQSVRLTASMPGFDDATLDVSVVPRRVEFSDLAGNRGLGGDVDGVWPRWLGSRGGDESLDADAAHTIRFEIREESPADTLPEPAIVDYAGDALTEIIVEAGWSCCSWLYIASPTHAGSYRIAAIEGSELIGLSDVQYVLNGAVESNLAWNERDADGSVVAGQGLKRTVPLSLRIGGPAGSADAVLHFRSRSPGSVQVPESLTLTPEFDGQYEVDLPVVGLEVTSEPVYVDVYVADDSKPAYSFPVMVYAPTLVFDTAAARAIHGSPAPLSLAWQVDFPCPPPQPGFAIADVPDICSLYGLPPAADQTFDLSIVNAGNPPVVDGFLPDDGSGMATLNFPAGSTVSESLVIDTPNAAGSYQIEARLGPGRTWQSKAVVVDVPQLVVVGEDDWVPTTIVAMPNFYGDLRLNARVNGTDTPLGISTPVQIRCADSAICGVEAEAVIPAGSSGIPIRLTGLALGSSEILATAIGLLDADPPAVDVVPPKLEISGPYSSIKVGEEKSFWVQVYAPYSNMKGSVDELVVDLSSAVPTVVSIPESVVIAPGTFVVEARAKGMRSGTTAVIGHEASLGSAVSNLIIVTSN